MTAKKTKSSVREEQIGEDKKTDIKDQKVNTKDNPKESAEKEDKKKKTDSKKTDSVKKAKKSVTDDDSEGDPIIQTVQNVDEEKASKEKEVAVVEEDIPADKKKKDEPEEKKPEKKKSAEKKKSSAEESKKAGREIIREEEAEAKTKTEDKTEGKKNEEGKKQEETKEEKEIIDYAKLSRKDLVLVLKEIIDKEDIHDIKDDVETIKVNFYKKLKAENEKIRKKFLEEGGQPEDFKIEEHPEEIEFKELLVKFKEKKADYNKYLEGEKQKNLEEKYRIIEEIKDLANRQESINKTFQEFRELQRRWRSVGLVPQASLKDLWETYHHHVEAFYDYIKINKELRDLDLKKNLESKIELCEKAEELLIEPSVVEAFKKLQVLHEQWREIGPVPADKRTEIWERFKDATRKINKKHQEYFIGLKAEQKSNLEAKKVLCEKVEKILEEEISKLSDWEKYSKEIIELQKVWRTIGFAPKKDNNKIYQRFRDACDRFFNAKREFYSKSLEEYNDNLQLKMDLCVQAESLQDSTEWKKTTEELVNLQKRWKEIGPVPVKQSEKIWKRFRAACDKFFNNKKKHFSNVESDYDDNLKKKEELIEELKKLESSGKVQEDLKRLKEIQRQWSEIGFVPYEMKDKIQEEFRVAINNRFDNLNINENKRNELKFKAKLENILSKPNAEHRLNLEREKFINKLKQLESDIVVWENNIGFFAKSENADSMITDIKNKIKKAKDRIEMLKTRIRLIDDILEKI